MKKLIILLFVSLLASCEGGSDGAAAESASSGAAETIVVATSITFANGTYNSGCTNLTVGTSKDYQLNISDSIVSIIQNTYETGDCSSGTGMHWLTIYMDRNESVLTFDRQGFIAKYAYLYWDICADVATSGVTYTFSISCGLGWDQDDLSISQSGDDYTIEGNTFIKQ